MLNTLVSKSGTKRKLSMLGVVLAASCAANIHAATDPRDFVLTYAEDKLEQSVRKHIQEKWNQDLLPDILESLGGEDFKDKFGGQLVTSLIGGLPGIAFNVILGAASSGPSEMQVMTEVLLSAIKDSEENILNAIEDYDDDVTRDSLRSLTNWWEKYNSSKLWADQLDGLTQMSWEAEKIKTRLEFSGLKAADTIQLYILAASLEAQIDKHLISLLVLNENPLATEEDIWQEYQGVFRTFVSGVARYAVLGAGGEYSRAVQLDSGEVVSSYEPVRQVINEWWEKAGFSERPLSKTEWNTIAQRFEFGEGEVTGSDETGQFKLKLGWAAGHLSNVSGLIRETYTSEDGSQSSRTLSVDRLTAPEGVMKITTTESGTYRYERLSFCMESMGRYWSCERGGIVTVRVEVDE